MDLDNYANATVSYLLLGIGVLDYKDFISPLALLILMIGAWVVQKYSLEMMSVLGIEESDTFEEPLIKTVVISLNFMFIFFLISRALNIPIFIRLFKDALVYLPLYFIASVNVKFLENAEDIPFVIEEKEDNWRRLYPGVVKVITLFAGILGVGLYILRMSLG